uniref:Syndecan/Neurexin domain-containing protein n=1 Tax=Panagrolaimus sp. JU765 TaxID=591449 RepID=A0AC34R7P1_9BILA
MRRRKSLAAFFVLIFFCLEFGAVESKKSDIVEGSGIPPSLAGNKNVVAADIDWEASGIGPDDEDGDVVEGSGSVPMSQKDRDEVEGSGLPVPVPKKPVVIPDEPQVEEIAKTDKPTTTSTEPTTLTPIGTTVITITKDEVEKDLESELKFPGNDDAQKEEDEDDDEEEEEEDTSTEATTTTERTTTRRPVIVAVTEPPMSDDDSDADALKNMLQPGILAAITGGAVVGILLAILLIMFIEVIRWMKTRIIRQITRTRIRKPQHRNFTLEKSSSFILRLGAKEYVLSANFICPQCRICPE